MSRSRLVSTTDETTGEVTRTDEPATTNYRDLESMTEDLLLAYLAAAAQAAADGSGGVAGIAPVCESFMRVVQGGQATRDFYSADAATDGLLDLWFDDGTHASKYGSYLGALTLFGTLTGVEPMSLGADEIAAADLDVGAAYALALQRVASEQLGFTTPVPEPATVALWAAGVLAVGAKVARRRRG